MAKRKQTFSSEELGLLDAIHANPRDGTPRLVYADWLEEEYPDELEHLLRRAAQGDQTAVPSVAAALDRFPELAGHFGDLVATAERPLLQLAAGGNPLMVEAIAREQKALRE